MFLLPTGSEDLLSVKKWGAGPTGVALRQDGPWTYGLLANHIWSFAGSGKQDVNATFLQPFASYTTPTAWSFALNTESTYDWEREQWALPINGICPVRRTLATVRESPCAIKVGAGVVRD